MRHLRNRVREQGVTRIGPGLSRLLQTLEVSAVLGVCDFGGERGTSALAWRVDDGSIEGVDVSGLGVALLASTIDRETKWRAVIHVDERATPVQHDALLKLVTGQLGGAFAELATLIGEVSAIKRSSIRIDLDSHNARLSIGASVDP